MEHSIEKFLYMNNVNLFGESKRKRFFINKLPHYDMFSKI